MMNMLNFQPIYILMDLNHAYWQSHCHAIPVLVDGYDIDIRIGS
jgi:hypothetical protein